MSPKEINKHKKTILETRKIIENAYRTPVVSQLTDKQRESLEKLHKEENTIIKDSSDVERDIRRLLKKKQRLSKSLAQVVRSRNKIIFPKK